jgi:toxin YhaV
MTGLRNGGGWKVVAHPRFVQQLTDLIKQVESQKAKDPKGYRSKNAFKRLAAIVHLAFDAIPQDPTRDEYRQGGTLGDEYKHWFRAKFYQQYRLFFRYHLGSKVIALAWVNDADTKRAYDSSTDAYKMFRKMLDKGNPPHSWDALLAQCKSSARTLKQAFEAANKVD